MIQTTRHQPLSRHLVNQTGTAGPTQHRSAGLTAVVNKFGQEQYQQYIQGIKANEYLRGMQEAAAGRTVQEIENGLSVVDRFFGMTDAAQAARAYHTASEAYKVQEEISQHQPELAAMPPDEARMHLQQMLFKPRTGDTATDSAIAQRALSMMPQVFSQHAKAHEAYNQQQAKLYQMQSTMGAARHAAGVLQQAAQDPDNPGSQAMMAQAIEDLVQAAQPTAGQDLEVWRSGMFEVYRDLITNVGRERVVTDADGNKRTVVDNGFVMQALQKSGLRDLLPEKELTALMRMEDQARSRLKKRLGPDMIRDLSQWTARSHVSMGGPDTARRHVEAGIDLNRKFAMMTGLEGLISDDELVASASTKQQAIGRKQEQIVERRMKQEEMLLAEARKRRDKEMERWLELKAKDDILTLAKTNQPQFQFMLQSGAITEKAAKEAFTMALIGNEELGMKPATWEDRIAWADSWGLGAHPHIAQPIQATAATVLNPEFSAKNPDAVLQLLDKFEAFEAAVGPTKTALNYGQWYDKLKVMQAARQSGEQDGVLLSRMAGGNINSTRASDTDIRNAVDAFIKENSGNNWLTRLWNPINGDGSAQMRESILRGMEKEMRTMPHHDLKAAAKVAFNRISANTRFVGDYAYRVEDDLDPVGFLTRATNVDEPMTMSEAQELTSDFIGDKLYGSAYWSEGHVDQSGQWVFKRRADSVFLAPIPDKKGKPALLVDYITEDGRTGRLTVSTDELYNAAKEMKAKRKASKEARVKARNSYSVRSIQRGDVFIPEY